MASGSGLYGIRKSNNTPKDPSPSTSLAFTSTLSNLLSNPTREQQPGRPRVSKGKPDIFSSHNKNTKKRAAQDLEGSDNHRQIHEEGVEHSVLHRSKKKLEEKAKQYHALERGDHLAGEHEPQSLIDFDQKWAASERQGRRAGDTSDTESDSGQTETVSYEDEFGRERKGTMTEAKRMELKKLNRARGQDELNRMSARPLMPDRLIYGDTVQTAAFNPDELATVQMEEIAKKRDRSTTPPEQKHYEADKEFRIKGVGFYSFSKDSEIREEEMLALERERLATEKARRERGMRKEKRQQEVEARREEIRQRRVKKQADNFLDGLTTDLQPPGT